VESQICVLSPRRKATTLTTITTPLRPPLSQLIIYALGQLGWSLAAYGAANLLVYFYLPPEDANQASFPPFIFQGAVLGIATVIGFINFGGRLFDAITDPLIAAWSDRRAPRGGKRRKVLAIAALPFAALSFLIFLPPTPGISSLNTVWLVGTVFLFYFFLTLYVVPYTALISELGHHPPDRMRISTLISITWALGFVIGGTAYGLKDYFSNYTDPVRAFQWAMGLFAVLSLVFMLVPVFFLRESRYAHQVDTTVSSPFQSLRTVFAERNFQLFIISDLFYWLALTFIQQGVSFYVVTLFRLPEAQATVFLMISFLASFACYWPINLAVRRFGKKRILLSAFLVFSLVFALTGALRWLQFPSTPLFYTLALLSAYPLAAFGIIPNALVADFIEAHTLRTGSQQAGMFYAVRNFMMKVGIGLSLLIFPSLLLLGKSVEAPQGVIISALVACGFCLLGYMIFRRVKT
jgi:GPH family glycoside/pentoside/hexuronide:cation symporter